MAFDRKAWEKGRYRRHRGKGPLEFKRYLFDQSIWAKFKIRRVRYDELVIAQLGRCAICEETPKLGLDIDHCHKTGKVRGLLCRTCNAWIGHLENEQWLKKANEYLLDTSPLGSPLKG